MWDGNCEDVGILHVYACIAKSAALVRTVSNLQKQNGRFDGFLLNRGEDIGMRHVVALALHSHGIEPSFVHTTKLYSGYG